MKLKILILIVALSLISGCDTFQEMSDLKSNYNALSEEAFNESAEIGWRVVNGRITFIEIMYPSRSFAGRDIQDVERKVNEILEQILDQRPALVKLTFVLDATKELKPVVTITGEDLEAAGIEGTLADIFTGTLSEEDKQVEVSPEEWSEIKKGAKQIGTGAVEIWYHKDSNTYYSITDGVIRTGK